MKTWLLAAAIASMATSTAHAQSNWDWSAFPDEGEKAVIGCSDSTTDDDWVCLAVRCEAAGTLGLYAELTDLSLNVSFRLVIDGEAFPVTGATRDESKPYSNRLSGDVPAIVAAMKSGAAVKIDVAGGALNRGFDTIPLRGSSRALSALETQCGMEGLAGEEKGQGKSVAAGLSSEAISPTARKLVEQVMADACFGAVPRMESRGVTERDLTGDVAADLVIDAATISCDGRPTNGLCGQMSCSTDVYQRQGNDYALALTVLGTISIGGGDPPALTVEEDFGEPYEVRWNGAEFE